MPLLKGLRSLLGLTDDQEAGNIPIEVGVPDDNSAIGVLERDVKEDTMRERSPLETALEQANSLLEREGSQERRRAEESLRDEFRGQYVAFVERQEDGEVRREVVAVASTRTELCRKLTDVTGHAPDCEPTLQVRFFE